MQLQPDTLKDLGNRVDQDFRAAIGDHQTRMKRWARYYRRWRGSVDAPDAGDEDKSNVQVPLLQWMTLGKMAKELDAVLGDGMEVIAEPTGAADQSIVAKVGRFMTWRVRNSMDLFEPLSVFDFRRVLFGRTHAYAPWERTTFDTPEGPQVCYDGPGFFPIWPDDLVVPAEDVVSIQDFSFVIRRYRVTPEDLLRGEKDGRYQDISAEIIAEVKRYAMQGRQRDGENEEMTAERDLAEGVQYDGSMSAKGSLPIWEWYGKADGHEIVARYSPDLQRVVGVQDLMELYPRQRRRRPLVEGSLIKEGSYWGMGYGQLLEWAEAELTSNHNLFTDAGQFSVSPALFGKPTAGNSQAPLRIESGVMNWNDDPASIWQMKIAFDPTYSLTKEQMVMAIVERVTGMTDQSLGRSSDRPNAPRTASGQAMLLQEGDVRGTLEIKSLRDDLRRILRHFWELETQFPRPEVFFRVTEEAAGGLFETKRGGAIMTAEEFGGVYDFDIRFADSIFNRERRKEQGLALYQLDLLNPLINTNPRALWMVTNAVHKAMGDDQFSKLVPAPPDLGLPKSPDEEWTLLLQGEEVQAHAEDSDNLHLLRHFKQLDEQRDADRPDRPAMSALTGHIIEHQKQMRQKMLMKAMVDGLVRELAGNNAQTGGLNVQRPGVPVNMLGLQGFL